MAKREASLTTYRFGEPRGSGEGLRIGATRYPPRGVKKTEYAKRDLFDVRLPLLSPSRELIKWYLHGDGKGKVTEFFRHYRKEMAAPDQRDAIALLARVAEQTPIAIGCACEDFDACHRKALAELIRKQL